MASAVRVTPALWRKVQPLLPPDHPRVARHHGLSNRDALDAIVYVLSENVGWLTLSHEQWGAHGSTVWRRLRQWQDLGLWDEIGPLLADGLAGLDEAARQRLLTGRRGEDARHRRRWLKKPADI